MAFRCVCVHLLKIVDWSELYERGALVVLSLDKNEKLLLELFNGAEQA